MDRVRLLAMLAACWLMSGMPVSPLAGRVASATDNSLRQTAEFDLLRTNAARASAAQLRFAPQPFSFGEVRPVRQIWLVNGDKLTGAILGGSTAAVAVRVFGQVRLQVPLRLIDRITGLPGERILVDEGFSEPTPLSARFDSAKRFAPPEIRQGVLTVASGPRPVRILLPNCSGDFQCRFRLRTIAADENASAESISWSAHFTDGSSLLTRWNPRQRVWQTTPTSSDSTHERFSAVPGRPGWQTFRLQQVASRCYLTVDEHLLFVGPAAGGGLQALEFAVAATGDALRLERLTLVEVGARTEELPPREAQADAIAGIQAETWWGDVQRLDQRGVAWSDGTATWRRNWSEIAGIQFRSPPHPVTGLPLLGSIVQLELQPSADRPDLPGDRLKVALGPSRADSLAVDHPLLGRLMIPRRAIRRVESRFVGRWQLGEARELSPSVRADSGSSTKSAEPAGLTGSFTLEELPRETCYVSIEATGLEPAGPGTPPGSPRLKLLREGRFVTELFVNERRIGDFNALANDWSLPGTFDRLRMPLPAGCLKAGHNTFRIETQPGDAPRPRLDPCRVRNVSLEIEARFP